MRMFVIVLALVFGLGTLFANEDKFMQISLQQARIESLQAERAAKYDELSACAATADKFTIAGISAISATNLSLAVNKTLISRLKSSGDRNGGGYGMSKDTRSIEQQVDDECNMYCETPGMECVCEHCCNNYDEDECNACLKL